MCSSRAIQTGILCDRWSDLTYYLTLLHSLPSCTVPLVIVWPDV
uniref:Uncharacterized protein n=1 Tax=Rhizophora mucronata TaxID=61149 RepID=A0A2P2NUZ2_RHIMU